MTKTSAPTAPINPAAAALLAQITPGVTKLAMIKKDWIPADLVVDITAKSVIFADGTRANIRSLHNFKIA